MISRFILFKGVIDSLNAFADELAQGMKENGCEVLTADVNELRCQDNTLFEKINDFIYSKPAGIIFFNNIGMLMQDNNGGNFWNKSNVKCFDILVDPPFFYDNAICSDIKNVTFVCVDEEHAEYINKYYGKGSLYNEKTGNIRHAVFMPLAGIEYKEIECRSGNGQVIAGKTAGNCKNAYREYSKRGMDVVFTGNIMNYNDIDTETERFNDGLKQLWDIVYEQILSDTNLTIESSIRLAMQQYEMQLTDAQVHQCILLFKRMDSVLRARFRAKVIDTLTGAGIVVNVFGDGWEDVKISNRKNLVIHKPVTYMESVKVMQDSKIGLNVMPWFKRGFHDRIATAALNGCVCVTDTSTYIRSKYIDGQDIIYYDLNKLGGLPDKIKRILGDPYHAQVIAGNGRRKSLEYDTWKNRAADFINETWKI